MGYNVPHNLTDYKVMALSTELFLQRHPVFDVRLLAEEVGSEKSLRAAHERAKYHVSQGRLKRIARGLYAAVPPGVSPDRFSPDPYLVAAAARPDGVFCYHSALELHGVAYSTWNSCAVFTKRRRAALKLNGNEVSFLCHPAPLSKAQREVTGVSQVERSGQRLSVTTPERTLVEGFHNLSRVGGAQELCASVSGFGVLDLEHLQEMLSLYNQKRLWAAAGWFLERYRERFYVSDAVLDSFRRHRPESPQYLGRGGPAGVMMRDWNLILPESLVQGWEGHGD